MKTSSFSINSIIASSNYRSILSCVLLSAISLFMVILTSCSDTSGSNPVGTDQKMVQSNYVTLKGGPFSKSTIIYFGDNIASYDSDNMVYWGGVVNDNYKMPNGSLNTVTLIQFFGNTPKTGTITFNPSKNIFSGLIIESNNGSEVTYLGIEGTLKVDKFDITGNVEGSFECTMIESEYGDETIQASGNFSMTYASYIAFAKSNTFSNSLNQELFNKIQK